jgi:hypothetical protein
MIEVPQTGMRSISVTWTATVELTEAHFALDAIQKMVGDLHHTSFTMGWFAAPPDVNVFGDWHIPSLPADAPYRSLQWYVDNSYDWAEDGIVGRTYLDLIANEPWQTQNPHYDLSIVGRRFVRGDGGPDGSDALALSIPGVVSAISLAPLRSIGNDRLRLLTVRRVTAHQLGHLLGIPLPDSMHAVEAGNYERHCTQLCVMSEASDLDELAQAALREVNASVLLCPACRRDLRRLMLDTYLVVN